MVYHYQAIKRFNVIVIFVVCRKFYQGQKSYDNLHLYILQSYEPPAYLFRT